ncbi:MAG: type II toxin-antitoxin system RelE/ParE family toxin [Candidatus Scalindua sp.]|nr:type II toxin-antitoxin system RelE/ParE family toxin [Candidatus Scalindua sp.]
MQRLFEKADCNKISSQGVRKREHIPAVLNHATELSDRGLPGFHLHPLKGRMKSFWSVTLRASWRVIFKIKNGDVHDVDLIDYHQEENMKSSPHPGRLIV